MNPPGRDLVIDALREPAALPHWSPTQWDCLVRQARRAGLLARLAERLDERGLLDRVAAGPRAHLDAARILARAQHDEVRREVGFIRNALAPLGVQPVLLKGAAYVLAGLPAALGRLFSDVDILVPRDRLAEVEATLMLNGWATTHLSPYDQRYYRQWMHELPPLQHIHRHTVLDVHHAILPDTARLRPDSGTLLATARPIAGAAGLKVLAAPDIVLHSMAHLFHNDELSHGLRDLSDLDLLLRHFGASPGFWGQLAERARQLELARPLHYGLRYARHVLGTPVAPQAIEAAGHAAPGWPLAPAMDALWLRALRSPHPTAADGLTPAALFFLYVRAHWLRMPPGLLIRHLWTKAVRRPEPLEVRA